MKTIQLSALILCTASASVPAIGFAASEESAIALTIRVLQVDPDRVSEQAIRNGLRGLSYTGLPANYSGQLPPGQPALPQGPVTAELSTQTANPDGSSRLFQSPSMAFGFVRRDGRIEFDGRSHDVAVGDDQPQSPFRSIAAPRLAANPGQQAQVVMGRPVTYLEPVQGGRFFQEVEMKDEFEGVSIDATASRTADGRIVIDRLEITLSEIMGRLPVPMLQIQAGRPLMRKSSISASFEIPRDMIALIPFTSDDDSQELDLIVLVSAEDHPAKP